MCLLKKGIVAVLFITVSCAPAGAQFNVDLTIKPTLAITDDPVTFTCSHGPVGNLGAVFYTLFRENGEIAAEINVNCMESQVTETKCIFSSCNHEGTSCNSLVVKDIPARRDTMQNNYYCRVQRLSKTYDQTDGDSPIVRLTVGDKTPPIETFRILNKNTNQEIADNTKLEAGTPTNVLCQTQPASPEPAFVVSITGKENRTNQTVGHKIEFEEAVPREPTVVYTCEAFNGFGERRTRTITLLATYKAIASEVTVPSETPIQTESDITICSARNNPSERLSITEIDQALLQEGYPKYSETPGLSTAVVRLSSKAAEIKDAKLEFVCKMGNEVLARASVALVSTNSAMMTAGIVIAAILAFVIIAAGIAYALKRRSAAPKPASDKAGYGRVNQNDAPAAARNP
ncbi:hypothetical protein BOX15_Mlig008819g1 [Macrostomum lignano]|uniref:Ig-like domain-containing protein n=1 Tax=Macrostomum lignano TaxID=282301 RepID=A0A267FBH5_9PLAT|nr:hypothetical protein BOX15_Mlig008819g1 [Macrostomum lignano]